MKYLTICLAGLMLSLGSVEAEITEYPSFYFWKSSYVTMEKATIVGTWRKPKKTVESDADVTYVFRSDGVAIIEVVGSDGHKSKQVTRWKQRKNAMVYLLRSPSPEIKEKRRFEYVGFVDKQGFVADQFCYQDLYSKVKVDVNN